LISTSIVGLRFTIVNHTGAVFAFKAERADALATVFYIPHKTIILAYRRKSSTLVNYNEDISFGLIIATIMQHTSALIIKVKVFHIVETQTVSVADQELQMIIVNAHNWLSVNGEILENTVDKRTGSSDFYRSHA
jgi:hypothetical protein